MGAKTTPKDKAFLGMNRDKSNPKDKASLGMDGDKNNS